MWSKIKTNLDAKADKSYVDTIANEPVTYTDYTEKFKTALATTFSGIAVNSSKLKVAKKGKLVQLSMKVLIMGDLKVAHNNASLDIRFADIGIPTMNATIESLTDQLVANMSGSNSTQFMEIENITVFPHKFNVVGFNKVYGSTINTLSFNKTFTYIAE